MNIYDSIIWRKDVEKAMTILPELEKLSGKSVMITGCTGLICSAVIDVIIRWNETHPAKIHILAAGRSEQKVVERFEPYAHKDWFVYLPYDAVSENTFPIGCDYIIHGAGNASPDKIVSEPVETMLSNFMGMKHLLDLAKEQNTKRLLFISSSEVYGIRQHDRPSKTDDYGWIDLLNPRSSYSIGKCAAETLCAAYYDEYRVESVIVRPGHVYGPTAMESDQRVSSAWAYAVARGNDIVMKSDGSQIRSYCYCLDSATAILKVLLQGKPVHAYNISNPDSIITIREMAEILTKKAGVKLKMEPPTEAEKKGFNPMRDSSLDSTELIDLGWRGLFDAENGLAHTVDILKQILK